MCNIFDFLYKKFVLTPKSGYVGSLEDLYMRVIAGTARRIQLITPKGLETRPTTDRIKETLFNIIQPYLADCDFLDLFSGSGAIGIEALSRGAKKATFVENKKEAITCIEKNLFATKLKEQGEILGMEAIEALQKLKINQRTFDIIFLDPPYHNRYEQKILEFLKDTHLLKEDGIIIFEAALNTEIDFVEQFGFQVKKVKQYKTNKHVFVVK